MVKKQTEFPFSLEDRMGCTTSPIIAIAESFEAVRVVHRTIYPEPRVVDHTILRMHISKDRETSTKDRTIYYVPPASETPLPTHLAYLRRHALEAGATPEAVRLLGSLEPWTKKEEAIMAEKLKSKGTAAKPDKDGLKAGAKKAPAGGAKKRGNPEALAKARAARSNEPDNRKIKVLIKKPEAREGSYRARMLAALVSSKTVAEFRAKDKAFTAGDLGYAVKAGIVSVA